MTGRDAGYGAGYDAARLATTLRAELRGNVADDPGTRALFVSDASNYRVAPDLVVTPLDVDDLTVAVTCCAAVSAPVTMRGGGTSLAGNAIGGVVIDTSRHLTTILDVDPQTRTAVVEPGVVLTRLLAAAAPYGLTFGADPSSASRATLGGMIANNACGAHSVAWGTTSDNLRGLDVVLADGTLLDLDVPGAGAADERRTALSSRPGRAGRLALELGRIVDTHATLIERRFGTFSRQVSGYALQHLRGDHGPDLARLLCGSEGSLAVTRRATVALTPLPAASVLLVLGFADAIAAADSVPLLLAHSPLTVESLSATLLDRLPEQVRRRAASAGLPDGSTWLLVELAGADAAAAQGAAASVVEALRDSGSPATAAVVVEAARQSVIWRCRRDSAGLATRRADGSEAWSGWEDAAVPPAKLGEYLRGLDEILDRFALSGASYGHFGEGCLHLRLDFDLASARGVGHYRDFVEEAADLVISLGGSVSGEHGDGRARSELLTRMYGADTVAVFAEVKRAFDPTGVMNPHVVVDPRPLDADLRPPRAVTRALDDVTFFDYRDDPDGFVGAQRRCVGVGKCRQDTGGVMCPSFQVTHEERNSTRGRARLLGEMLDGSLITDGWRSTEVRDALDLCLSCKGCLSDCPVNVDMATYKAEFTAHHYARRPWARPRSHLSMGWLPLWLRLGSHAPRLANALTGSVAGGVLKRLGGVTPHRDIPRLAATTFTSWFASRPPAPPGGVGGREVLLLPDTFTNYLSPEIAIAAVDVLEDAGFTVRLPAAPVCCGLTWVSTGQLATARRVLRRSLVVLEPWLQAKVPIVGLEPSCTAMLQHDAPSLLGHDPLARALGDSTYSFAAALTELAPQWQPPYVGGAALAQPHCHQHAVSGFGADESLLVAAGVSVELPDAGCCGLAGNFGFEAAHYDLSMAVGERVLLPRVRAKAPGSVVLADGFSCRTQVEHGTGTAALHLAQLLAGALADRRESRGSAG